MRAIRQVRLVWWVATGCILALVAILYHAFNRGWTPEKVERLVNHELPLGSHRVEIESFLDAQGWPRSFGGSENRFYAERSGMKANELSQISGVVFGEVISPNVGLFAKGEISVKFYLDSNERLIKASVDVWIFGL